MSKRPILVTGSHRSGSTWIGRILESSGKLRYVHEPFNIENKRGFSPFNYWFEHISEKTKIQHQSAAEAYLRSFFSRSPKSFFSNLKKVRTSRGFYFFLKDFQNRMTKRTVLKDPIALLSAEWIHKKTHCDVVVSIRHPAAFVASLKIKEWAFDFNHFLQQEELMHSHLKPFGDEIKHFATYPPSIIEQGILLWNILYTVALNYKEKYGETWFFVRHEDLSDDPITAFEKMFDYLEVPFSASVKNKILNTTTNNVATEHQRNAKENKFSWKKRLTVSEIALIKEKTSPLWKKYYSESDWN
jgi:hypothetical protein